MIFTKADWKRDFLQDIEPFRDPETKTAEIDEEVYYNFLESLPPIYIWKGFMNSEPHNHNEKGQAEYLAFQNIGEKYYYIGTLTREQAKLLS